MNFYVIVRSQSPCLLSSHNMNNLLMLFRPSLWQIFKRTRKASKKHFCQSSSWYVAPSRHSKGFIRCSCPMNACDEPLRTSVLEAILHLVFVEIYYCFITIRSENAHPKTKNPHKLRVNTRNCRAKKWRSSSFTVQGAKKAIFTWG